MKNLNNTVLFILLTFTISYLAAAAFYWSGASLNGAPGMIFAISYMFIPLLSAIIASRVNRTEPLKRRLLISFRLNQWFFIGWALIPAMAFLALGISLLLPGIDYSPDMTGFMERFAEMIPPDQMEEAKKSLESLPIHPLLLTAVQGIIAGVTINAVAAFGEEAAWRGFLLTSLNGVSFMRAAALIGFIWGIWHAPLILMGHNYPQHPQAGIVMMTAWCIALTPIFLYFTLKSGSVITAAVMHGTLNGTAGISLIALKGGTDLTAGMTGIAGLVTTLLVVAALFFYDKFISREGIMSRAISIEQKSIISR